MSIDVPPTEQLPEFPPAILSSIESGDYRPRHSLIREGFELSSLHFDGRSYAAIGFRKGMRIFGAEIGHKFRETSGGFTTGLSLTSYYDWVKRESDTEVKYIMAQQNKIGQHGRVLYDIGLAYNFASGAYASGTAKREFYGRQDYGIFKNVTPYVSLTISTDRGRSNIRMGFTTVVYVINDSRLLLDVAVRATHGAPEFVVGSSLRFR